MAKLVTKLYPAGQLREKVLLPVCPMLAKAWYINRNPGWRSLARRVRAGRLTRRSLLGEIV